MISNILISLFLLLNIPGVKTWQDCGETGCVSGPDGSDDGRGGGDEKSSPGSNDREHRGSVPHWTPNYDKPSSPHRQETKGNGKRKEPYEVPSKKRDTNTPYKSDGKASEQELERDRRDWEEANTKLLYGIDNVILRNNYDNAHHQLQNIGAHDGRRMMLDDAFKKLINQDDAIKKREWVKAKELQDEANLLIDRALAADFWEYYAYEEQHWKKRREESPDYYRHHMWMYGKKHTKYLKVQLDDFYYPRIKNMDHYDKRKKYVDYARIALSEASHYYDAYEYHLVPKKNPPCPRDFEDISLREESHEALDQVYLAEILLDLAIDVSVDIFVGWPRDMAEAISGTNVLTGEELDTFDRSFAIAGAATGGAISKLRKPLKALSKIMANNKYTQKAYKMAENLIKNNSEKVVDQVRDFYNRHKISEKLTYAPDAEKFSESLQKPINISTLSHDKDAFRYYDADFAKTDPRGHWLTWEKIDNPRAELALPRDGNYVAHKWTIPKGTEILESTAAPLYGQPGGVRQIFIPNKDVLIKPKVAKKRIRLKDL